MEMNGSKRDSIYSVGTNGSRYARGRIEQMGRGGRPKAAAESRSMSLRDSRPWMNGEHGDGYDGEAPKHGEIGNMAELFKLHAWGKQL